ncbi:hypothetical protein POM88_044698 [Heracleum sosnowskyi]|uniref:Uncharacterized protein n=1 Tax=Heracleum sosnowskyi TaxID=360622 RepID=A0AAD8H5V5_9APIA|nr:hypothetical protein POM88_044698 [Heracleum sosnowskyi]
MTEVPRKVPVKSINSNGVTYTVDGECLTVFNLLKKPMNIIIVQSLWIRMRRKWTRVIKKKKKEPPLSRPELLDGEVNVSSLSPSKSVLDECTSKKVGVSKKKDVVAQEPASVDSALKIAIDGTVV